MIVPRHMKLVLSMHASFIISPTRPKKEGWLSLFGRQVSPNIAGGAFWNSGPTLFCIEEVMECEEIQIKAVKTVKLFLRFLFVHVLAFKLHTNIKAL